MNTAFQQGYDAWLDGLDTVDNPYSEENEPRLFQLWESGWWEAEEPNQNDTDGRLLFSPRY